ncbi:hypothetical protein PI124_g713 [Phytophthora idaei]|nr:hypothetical protein PI125_g499 [Phytophthora idaei]KAG3174402.1 hypothetical protein PI126_g373 [Phytophthora idaei]KAG3254742.1 hypothetical protein PI124_g713 [Phytophthora idaei]
MAVVEANDPRVESGANAWSSMLTDAVAKCGRDSERRLYMYGISSNRCPKCQSRLRADNNTCVSCHYSHKTLRKCMRCSQKNDPVMWCAECDAYFCANCHKKPHVLMLGSTKPHHCFPIDGASGKYFVEAAWSDELTEMVRAAYRLRYHDKMQADEAKAKSTEQQATAAVNGAVGQTVSAEGASSTAAPTGTSAVMSGAAGTSSASTATVPPITGVQEQSRKRQPPEQDDGRDKKTIRADESSHSGVKSAAAPTDGMSLYDRVKAMHDMRARATQSNSAQARSPKTNLNQLLSQQNEERMRQKQEQEERAKREADQILQREQHRQQEHERKEQLKQTQKRQKQEQDEQRRQQEEQRLQEIQRQQEDQRWNEEQRRQEDQRRQEERRLHALIQEQQRQRRMMEDRMRHEQMLREQEARRQAEAHSLMHQGNQFVSQAQHVLHSQPGFAVASMAPSNISAPMPQTSTPRFTRIPSPVNVSPHAPRFQSASPSPSSQSFPFQPAPVSNGYPSMTNEHGSQVYQGHTGVPVSRFETISQDHDGSHHLVVRDPNVQQQQQQADFSDAMVPHRMTTGAGEGRFSPSKSGEDDELRAIWVSDYDNVNALVMQLDVEITKRTEEGHEFVHRSNNITIPEQLKIQISNLRAQRDSAIKKRFESIVRVLIFSEAVRSFARQNEHANIWGDVPAVLTSSHKKCAELAAEIREFECQAQKLREGIDEAVSSGNPAQMQNVAHLGVLIADLEQKTRASNGERDKQFIFMFQFSDTVRKMVRAEWAAPGRGLRLQASQ